MSVVRLSSSNLFRFGLQETGNQIYLRTAFIINCNLCLFQCRKYKQSEKIRHKAESLYAKFKKLFVPSEQELPPTKVTFS